MLAGTNIGGRSNDLKIRTYIIYSERFRSNDATMFGSSDDHIRASSCIVQHSAGARDGTIPGVVFNTDGSSGQRGRITVAKNIVARDGEHARSFHNNGVGVGKFRLTTGGTDGLDLEIVDTRSIERVGELRQRMASTTTSGNFNTIHIPNIGCSICRCGGNRHSRTSTNCVVGDSRSADQLWDVNYNGASFVKVLIESVPQVYTLDSTIIRVIQGPIWIRDLEKPTSNHAKTIRIMTVWSRDLNCYGGVHNLANFTLGEDGRCCNSSNRLDGNRITDEVVTSEILINRKDDILVACIRFGDLISVHISGGDMGTVLIPFPFPRLFVTGGVGVSGQHNRIGRANLRCGELRDRSRGDSEVVNRREGAFATATGNLHGKLMGERVIGQAGEVGGNETVRLAGCARNVVAVVFPLIIDGDVTAVLNHGGESHHIVLAGVMGADDIGSHIGRHSENHRIG